MSKANEKSKIQELLMHHLMYEGSIELRLPDGMVIEVGMTQENEEGDLEINPHYCWVIASQDDRAVNIDTYNLGLRYSQSKDKMVIEQDVISLDGKPTCVLEVV
jgi:hypothetical protein